MLRGPEILGQQGTFTDIFGLKWITSLISLMVDYGGTWFCLPQSGYSAVPNTGDAADQLLAA